MVLVPSLGLTAHVFETLAPQFTNRYRVLAITRRWHGASEQAGLHFDLDSLANDLAYAIEYFSNEPAVVLGWGWATQELATLARNHPDLVDALIFANGVVAELDVPAGVRGPPGQFAPDTVFSSIDVAVEAWLPYFDVEREVLRTLLSEAFVRREDGSFVAGPPVGTPALGRFLEMEDLSGAVYEGIQTPVLAIQVRQADYLASELEARGFPPDSIAVATSWATEFDDVRRDRGADLLRAAVPSAEVTELRGVSHNFILESPELVADKVNEFLSRIDP
ncbi:MAG: alpha/beta hydrolase [Gemmatimonadota bacterium]